MREILIEIDEEGNASIQQKGYTDENQESRVRKVIFDLKQIVKKYVEHMEKE